jgi:hypothetical protein
MRNGVFISAWRIRGCKTVSGIACPASSVAKPCRNHTPAHSLQFLLRHCGPFLLSFDDLLVCAARATRIALVFRILRPQKFLCRKQDSASNG